MELRPLQLSPVLILLLDPSLFTPRSPPYNNNNAQSSVCVCFVYGVFMGADSRTWPTAKLAKFHQSIYLSGQKSASFSISFLYASSSDVQMRSHLRKEKGLDPFLCLLFVAFNWKIVTQMALQVFLTRLNSSPPPFSKHFGNQQKTKE